MATVQSEVPQTRPIAQTLPLTSLKNPEPDLSGFVGSKACQGCHQSHFSKWADSTHGTAGGLANGKNIIPKQDERSFRFSDAAIRMRQLQDGFQFEVRHHQGKSSQGVERISVDGVVGVDAMLGGGGQAYLHRAPDGLLMHLPFEFNRSARRWFCQRREHRQVQGSTRVNYRWAQIDGTFPIADCVWPPKRTLGFSNKQNCGNCHGSQIDVSFDQKEQKFKTHVASYRINCESCHGPGRRHTELMSRDTDPGTDIGFSSLELLGKEASVRICMVCHASKSVVTPGYISGAPFDRHFATVTLSDPATRVTHFDGRVADFGYQEGHLYSACYLDGSMTCVDCHDPHDQSYRSVHGRSLQGRFDDGQCVGCHPSKDQSSHQDHGANGEEATCVSCHMPYHQHPSVPKDFRMERSDHAIAIPRPSVDEAIGVKNACGRCHHDRSLEWQRRGAMALYGKTKPRPSLVDSLFSISAQRDERSKQGQYGPSPSVGSVSSTIVSLTIDAPIAAISALSYLVQEWLFIGDEHWVPATMSSIQALMLARDADVRAAAFATLFVLSLNDAELHSSTLESLRSAQKASPGLPAKVQQSLFSVYHAYGQLDHGKSFRVLRQTIPLLNREPSRWLATKAKSLLELNRHDEAVALYEQAAKHESVRNSHRLGTGGGTAYQFWVEAGNVRMGQGRPNEAAPYFSRAQALHPMDTHSKRGLWTALAMMGRDREALPVLDEYMKLVPSFLDGYTYRARILMNMGRASEAKDSLNKALQLRPNNAQVRALLELISGRAPAP